MPGSLSNSERDVALGEVPTGLPRSVRAAGDLECSIPSELRLAGGESELQERQRELRLDVRLREDADGGLLQDRVARQVRGLGRDVDVADAALGGREVLARVQDRGHRARQPVLV